MAVYLKADIYIDAMTVIHFRRICVATFVTTHRMHAREYREEISRFVLIQQLHIVNWTTIVTRVNSRANATMTSREVMATSAV